MTHVRQQIREQVATDLIAAATTRGNRIHRSRIHRFQEDDLPTWAVYTGEEVIEETGDLPYPRRQIRQLQLILEGFQRAEPNLENDLDQMAAEVEAIIAADPTISNLAKDCILEQTDIELTTEGSLDLGLVRLTFLCEYHTSETDAETVLP